MISFTRFWRQRDFLIFNNLVQEQCFLGCLPFLFYMGKLYTFFTKLSIPSWSTTFGFMHAWLYKSGMHFIKQDPTEIWLYPTNSYCHISPPSSVWYDGIPLQTFAFRPACCILSYENSTLVLALKRGTHHCGIVLKWNLSDETRLEDCPWIISIFWRL